MHLPHRGSPTVLGVMHESLGCVLGSYRRDAQCPMGILVACICFQGQGACIPKGFNLHAAMDDLAEQDCSILFSIWYLQSMRLGNQYGIQSLVQIQHAPCRWPSPSSNYLLIHPLCRLGWWVCLPTQVLTSRLGLLVQQRCGG